jgi:hypothetical protein
LTRREREREEKGKKERRREQLRVSQKAAREKKAKAAELPLRNMIFLAASPMVRSMLETNPEKAEIQANYEQTLQTMMQARASAVKARNDQRIASLREVRRERADQRLADREARRAEQAARRTEQAADEESINNRWLAQQRDDNEGMAVLQDFANNHAQRLERMSTVKQNRAGGIRKGDDIAARLGVGAVDSPMGVGAADSPMLTTATSTAAGSAGSTTTSPQGMTLLGFDVNQEGDEKKKTTR